MGLMDLFKGKNQKLPDGRFYEQDEKFRKQQDQLNEQNERLNRQDEILNRQGEQIQAIAAKTKGLAREVQRINDERNTCVSTFTRYEPDKVQDIESNLIVRSLNKDSDYKYVATLVFRNENGNISDEIILAQFNNGELRKIKDKFVEQLEFQQFLTLGVLNEEKMNFTFEKLREYCEDSSIEITEEGKNILTNTKNEPRKITKSVIYMGDENTTIDAKLLGNISIIEGNYDDFTNEEIERMLRADKLVSKTVNTNNITNIDQAINLRRSDIVKYISENPELMSQYEQIIIKKNKRNLINEAYEHFSEVDDKFKSSGIEYYFKLLLQNKEQQAKEYYKENKMNVSNLMVKVQEGDTNVDIRRKFAIKRLLTYLDKENTKGISEKEKLIYDDFLLKAQTKDYSENIYINDEKIFLAGIVDRMKTNEVSEHEDNIQEYNDLLKRQEFGENIKYYIPPKYEEKDER